MTAGHRPGAKMRTALAASVAFSFVASMATSADAAIRKKKRAFTKSAAAISAVKKSNPERDGFVDVPKGGVLQIVISISNQSLTLFRDGVPVAQSPVSTGTGSHPTPTGVFSVIEKDRWHRSNLYGNAKMYFMQRVTWSGVAMHEGILPGYAASHGCIRLPRDFAARLWPTTRLGVRVIIARSDLMPVDFKHATLFAPTQKPAAPKVASIEPTDGAKPGRPIVLAEAATIVNNGMAQAHERAPHRSSANHAPAVIGDKPPDIAAVPAEVKPASATMDDVQPADVAAAPAEMKPLSDVRTEPAQTAEAAPVDDAINTTGAMVPLPRRNPQLSVIDLAGAVVPLPRRNPQLSGIDLAGAIVPLPQPNPQLLPNELRKAIEAPQANEPRQPGPSVELVDDIAKAWPANAPPQSVQAMPDNPAPAPATAPSSDDPVKPEPNLTDPPKPTAPRTRSADQPAKRRGQVAVFVSRKEKRIFVRQGFLPLFDMPVRIEDPDQPLGTHVFTAMAFTADGGAGMRWNLITMPEGPPRPMEEKRTKTRAGNIRSESAQPVVEARPSSSAAEALNRIQMPEEAVDRISELLIPGSSLVISDQGLGRETGRYTEFIVLTR